MEIEQALTPLSPLQIQLYPLLELFKRGDDRTRLQLRYAAYVQRVEKHKALRKIDKEVGREAKLFEQILSVSLTRMGFAYTPNQEHKTAAGGQKHRVQRVKFEAVRWNEELIWYRIQTRRRGLFAYKNVLPYKTYVTEIVDENTLNELSISCERKVSARWDRPDRGAWLLIHRLEGAGGIPRLVHFKECLQYYPADMSKGTMLLGVGEHRTIHYNDLAVAPHVLVGGQTGGGKSNLVNNFIASQLRFQDSETFKLVLVDLKRMEFGWYKEAPHLLCPVIYDPAEAIKHLKYVLKLIQERAALFDGKVKELSEWNKQYPDKKLPRIVTVIDEYAELMLSGSKMKRGITGLIARISALGRAAGIHLIICTQRPDASIVPGLIRMNMALTISGFAPNATQSMVIIGTGDAQNLPSNVKGRMIFARGSDKCEIQTPLISDDDVRESVRIAKGRYEGLIQLAPVDPVVIPEGLARFAVKHTRGSLAANDIVSLLRDYAIDFNMYKNAVEELTKRGVVEMNDRIYEVVPGEQGYRMQAVGGVEWVDTPEPAPAPILAIPAHVGELVIDVHPMPEPEIEDEDTQPAPLAPQFVDVDHEKMIRKFIVAKCETGRNKKIKTRDLYAAYAQWCKDGSIDAIDNINFSKILIGFEFKAVRSNGTRYMRGICLVEEPAVSQVPAGIA
jgi:hypothetical protein